MTIDERLAEMDHMLAGEGDFDRNEVAEATAWLLALCKRQRESLRSVHLWAKGRNKVAVVKMVQPALEEDDPTNV